MQSTTTKYNTLFAQSHDVLYTIGSLHSWVSNNLVGTPKITKPLLDDLSIGKVCGGTLTFSAYSNNFYTGQSVTVSCCLAPKNWKNILWYGTQSEFANCISEFIPQGTYIIQSRKSTGKSTLTYTCRDAMLKTGATYLDKVERTFPITASTIVSDIATVIGVTVDSRNSLSNNYSFAEGEIKSETTMQDLLSMIGVLNGGNWIISENNALRFIPVTAIKATADQSIGTNYTKRDRYRAYSYYINKVTITNNDGEKSVSGLTTGSYLKNIEVSCAVATTTTATTVKALILSRTSAVIPYKVYGALLNPAIELGDTVSIADRNDNWTTGIANSIEISCTPSYSATVASNLTEDEEYTYLTSAEQSSEKSVKTDQNYNGTNISRSGGLTTTMTNGATATMNSSTVAFVDEDGNNCFWYDETAGTYKIREESLPSSVTTDIDTLQTDMDTAQADIEDLQEAVEDIKTVSNIVTGSDTFTVTYTDGARVTWDYTLDSDGRITSITKQT